MTGAYLIRTLKSPRFGVSVLGVFLICLLRIVNHQIEATCVAKDLEFLVSVDSFRKVIGVFAAIPFVSNFAEEWNNGMTVSCVLRSNARKYAWSQAAVCMITAFITVMAGFVLFLLTDSFRLPWYLNDGNPHCLPYDPFLDGGLVWLDLLLVSVDFAWSCAMWSVMGLLMSAVFPSLFIAFSTPFVASYLLERITLNFPTRFNLLEVALSHVVVGNDPWLSFFWAMGLFAVPSFVCSRVFVMIVEKRMKHEFA